MLLLQGVPEPLPLNPIARWEWVFPFVEAIHVCGVAILVGTVLVLNLRLLGIVFRQQRISRLYSQLSPWIRRGLFIALVTGPYMFTSDSGDYVKITAFRNKMILLLCAVIFHFVVIRRVTTSSGEHLARAWRGFAACVSMGLWIGVMLGGLWIGNLSAPAR